MFLYQDTNERLKGSFIMGHPLHDDIEHEITISLMLHDFIELY